MSDLVCAGKESTAVDGDSIGLWWWRWSGELVSSGDTLANWILALFTGIGIFFLWRTLVQTNKTNDAAVRAANAAAEANRILRDEQRPWVTLEWEIGCEAIDLGHGLTLVWNYNFRNRGKSPAYNMILDLKMVKRRHIQGLKEEGGRFADLCLEKRKDFQSYTILFPEEITEFTRFNLDDSMLYQYIDTYGDNRFSHIIVFTCLSYQKSLDPDDLAFETRTLFVRRTEFEGPFQDRLLQFGSAHTVR